MADIGIIWGQDEIEYKTNANCKQIQYLAITGMDLPHARYIEMLPMSNHY